MKTTRALTAVALAALLALAGCSDESPTTSDPSGSAEPGQTASNPSADPSASEPQVPEADVADLPEVVAEVNGEQITREEFVADYESRLQQAAMSSDASQLDQDELKQQVAQTMVDHRLLVQAARETGIEPTEADVDATLEDIAAQSGLGSAEEVVAALAEHGMSEEEVRAEAADQFRVLGYIDAEADITEPTEAELRAQYEATVEQLSASGQDAEVPEFEEVRDQLAQQAVNEQQNAAAEELLTTLREQGEVTINL